MSRVVQRLRADFIVVITSSEAPTTTLNLQPQWQDHRLPSALSLLQVQGAMGTDAKFVIARNTTIIPSILVTILRLLLIPPSPLAALLHLRLMKLLQQKLPVFRCYWTGMVCDNGFSHGPPLGLLKAKHLLAFEGLLVTRVFQSHDEQAFGFRAG